MTIAFDSVGLVSIIPIKEDETNSSTDFGTGFCVHRDEKTTYLVTCAHVVEKAYLATQLYQIVVNGKPAIIEAYDRDVDIAVLRVEGLQSYPPLRLSASATEGQKIQIVGMPELPVGNNRSHRQFLALNGVLVKESGWAKGGRERIPTWYLKLDEVDFKLQKGYSGSPVIERETDCVVGVVSWQIRDGSTGTAISISAIKTVWETMPNNLSFVLDSSVNLKRPPSPYANRSKDWLKNDLEETEQEIQRLRRKCKDISREIHLIDRELATASGQERIRFNRLHEQLIQERQSQATTLKKLEEQYLEIEKEIEKR